MPYDKRRYIFVPYKERDAAKRLGARWDEQSKQWYYLPNSALAKVYAWQKP